MGLQFAEEGLASLSAIPTLYIPPGDYSQNGLVDAADYVAWRKTDGSPGGINLWRENFGNPVASNIGESLDGVPEPTAAMLLASLLLNVVPLARRSDRKR